MYKVIIVEDEMLVRIGLRSSVDWSKFNMMVAADLSDGQAAWNYCLNEGFPDLIITDIKMPKMDGMELITKVRKDNKETRIVVLSCLEEFELVRKAMSLGVSNYILKLTMTEEEIGTVLGAVRAELETQESLKDSKEKKPLVPPNMDLIKEKYLKDFLFYGIYSVEEFEQFAANSGLRLSQVRMMACTVEVDSYFVLKEKFKDKNGHLIKAALLNIFYEIMNACKRGETIYLDETHYLILFSFEDQVSEQSIHAEAHEVLNKVKDAIHTFFGGSVSFGISGVQSGFKSLRKLYFESMHALDRKFITGPGQKHKAEDAIDLGHINAQIDNLRAYTPLRDIISPMKQDELEQYLNAFSNALTGEKNAIRIMLYQFIQWVNANVHEDQHNENILLFQVTEKLNQCDTLPEMLEHVHEYIEKIVEESRSHLQMSKEISKAVQYIKQNYDRNISLQQVADHVNLSFGYLSNLFKKELRITFVEYLNCYRIERAKELLIKTNLKSYDIAVKVGFSPEYTYFSKVFKKMTGMNPNDFRKQYLPESRGYK
ncbi:response regulator [Paenibacillus sp. PAMC21692]|uniref:response regulator transcription factor n=1 Tax=Paenibacillus sp. PAMC21692 TaxID=2762320 RepID=UPI00164E407D|nr:response regulator [Paenibacillus sp. PAMC21692]QNK57040.1 response regulator [Paenibacillus sp. PAMC21692]